MRLSVITICLNEEKKIRKTLESVINQSFKEYEYIVIDGASSDSTMSIINEYRENIDIIMSEKDSGIYNAMNKGLTLAKGEYVIFLNGGDYFYENDTLEKVFSYDLSSSFVYGNILVKSENGFIRKSGPKNFKYHTLYKMVPPHQSTFIKKDLYLSIGFFDDSFKISGDRDFALRAIIKNKIIPQYIPVDIAVFDPEGISSNNLAEKKIESRIAKKKNFPALIFIVLDISFSGMKFIEKLKRRFLNIKF
jgi:glycosyltransferase involved in cell wall biosynthesis